MRKRIRCLKLLDKIVDAETAAAMIKDGMNIGTSGFSPCGYPKAIPLALAKRVRENNEKLQVSLFTGASVGDELDGEWTRAGIIKRRVPYQTNNDLRNSLNTAGGIDFQDPHIGLSSQLIRYGFYGPIDLAIVEACAITEEGHIIPTTSMGNSATYVQCASKVLVEINTSQPLELEGMHDIYLPQNPPARSHIPLYHADERIGTPYIPCGADKIAAIVITDIPDKVDNLAPISNEAKAMAANFMDFLRMEICKGRLPKELLPLQSGIGSVANAVLSGIMDSEFSNLDFFSEVIQDSAMELLDAGKFRFCSGTCLAPSPAGIKHFYENIDAYRQKMVLRTQEITNHPELIRRLGVIAMNTAIEADIYGNVNSTHIMGTRLMNGVGGSGEFARNAYFSAFFTASTAKGGAISSFVPMCSHVDHNEHDVSILVSERGIADLRNKSPRERALEIIRNCAHPDFQPMLMDYYQRALKANPPGACHTPHLLSEALSWHQRFKETGTMHIK